VFFLCCLSTTELATKINVILLTIFNSAYILYLTFFVTMDAYQKRLQDIITFWLMLASTGNEDVVWCKEIPVSQCSVSLAKSSAPKNVFVEFTSRKIVTKRLKGPIPGENYAHDLFIRNGASLSSRGQLAQPQCPPLSYSFFSLCSRVEACLF
jgi:hypothetical protein